MSAQLDSAPGGHASSDGGGGDRGGDEGSSPGPGGHQATFETPHEKRLQDAIRLGFTADCKRVTASGKVQREVHFSEPRRDLDLRAHVTYPHSVLIQAYGTENQGNARCTSCKRCVRAFPACVSFPVGEEPEARGDTPFQGECANCHWGGQGARCSLRAGGSRTPPRQLRAPLYQSSLYTNTHLGSKFDLNTAEGILAAISELHGIINLLKARGETIRKGKGVGEVPDEDEDNSEDGSSYAGTASESCNPQRPASASDLAARYHTRSQRPDAMRVIEPVLVPSYQPTPEPPSSPLESGSP